MRDAERTLRGELRIRFVVTFSHRKYLEIQDCLAKPHDGYEIPLGIYRQIAIVVDADSHEDALAVAEDELGWPDDESDLVPMGVASQTEVEVAIRESPLPARRREQSRNHR